MPKEMLYGGLKLENCVYIVQLFYTIICDVEMSEFLKWVHVFDDRDFIVGQFQHFKLPQRIQTFNFLDAVVGHIWRTHPELLLLVGRKCEHNLENKIYLT